MYAESQNLVEIPGHLDFAGSLAAGRFLRAFRSGDLDSSLIITAWATPRDLLISYEDGTDIPALVLGPLDPASSVALLRHSGVDGEEGELVEVASLLHCIPFSLHLFAGLVVQSSGGILDSEPAKHRVAGGAPADIVVEQVIAELSTKARHCLEVVACFGTWAPGDFVSTLDPEGLTELVDRYLVVRSDNGDVYISDILTHTFAKKSFDRIACHAQCAEYYYLHWIQDQSGQAKGTSQRLPVSLALLDHLLDAGHIEEATIFFKQHLEETVLERKDAWFVLCHCYKLMQQLLSTPDRNPLLEMGEGLCLFLLECAQVAYEYPICLTLLSGRIQRLEHIDAEKDDEVFATSEEIHTGAQDRKAKLLETLLRLSSINAMFGRSHDAEVILGRVLAGSESMGGEESQMAVKMIEIGILQLKGRGEELIELARSNKDSFMRVQKKLMDIMVPGGTTTLDFSHSQDGAESLLAAADRVEQVTQEFPTGSAEVAAFQVQIDLLRGAAHLAASKDKPSQRLEELILAENHIARSHEAARRAGLLIFKLQASMLLVELQKTQGGLQDALIVCDELLWLGDRTANQYLCASTHVEIADIAKKLDMKEKCIKHASLAMEIAQNPSNGYGFIEQRAHTLLNEIRA
jgi:hypothetical protein